MSYVRFQWIGLDEMIDEVARVGMDNERTYELTGPLTRVLQDAFADTQARVASPMNPHVPTYEPTGSLFNSGHTDTHFDGEVWIGEIIYGGESAPNDVDYAIYEMARGGIHDFFGGLPEFGERYLQAIHDYWENG